MRRLIGMIVLAVCLTGPAKADESAIRAVITNQIEALKADDFATAFGYASPMIQGIFGDADRFGVMVREGYPMVWRPSDVQFMNSEIINGEQWQNVLIRDASGRSYLLGYQMISGNNGWKINAVRIKRAEAGMV